MQLGLEASRDEGKVKGSPATHHYIASVTETPIGTANGQH